LENKYGILLDSGTNEVEFLEFLLADTSFGINVLKVREIIKPLTVTKIPHSHPHVEGIIELRGEVLPVINLRKALHIEKPHRRLEEIFIVSEFNGMQVILRVDHVTQIHRLSWTQMEKPASLYQGLENHITGVIKQHEKMILLLDVEKIMFDIYSNIDQDTKQPADGSNPARSIKKVVIAEDSPMLRKLLQVTLLEAGYKHIEFFENGKDAWNYMNNEVKNGQKKVDILITDIEMPQMDGHHLTKKMKEDKHLSKIPVIIFSSLITDYLHHKGEQVGADAQIGKPQLSKLVKVMDSYLLTHK
jgi:two-component system chemotaxis response regulator CheV